MKQKEIFVRLNERSWAIEIISRINKILEDNDLVIKRAGGELTISTGRGSRMFPDVILYGDKNLSLILQGWELKMPDVPITDEEFVHDAQRKAIALGLDSCVIWNFTHAIFYTFDNENNCFAVVKMWEHSQIKTRDDVALYLSEWEDTLKEVVFAVNDFVNGRNVRRVSVTDVISQNAIDILINENKKIVTECYRKQNMVNAVFGAKIDSWWERIKIEYSFDEVDKFSAYAKLIILNWAYRIIFAHLIKRQQNSAVLIDEWNSETTPEQAADIFRRITEKCDFYNVFAGLEYDTIMPNQTWNSLTDLSLFLKENGIQNINQEMLQNVLEKCINTTRRELDGQFTTPKILAHILVNITVHDWTSDCIDPCCGTGTIAHEILEKKKKIGCTVRSAVDTTWASDKYTVPLQIANISMTSGDTIDLANRLFQSNALGLYPGKIIDIVDPRDGVKLLHALPLMGAVCSNLPFVPFENIHDDDKVQISKLQNVRILDRKSDLSYYIAMHMSDLLMDNGYLGIIISNSWLGTSAGDLFYHELIKQYDLKQVHISGAGRWFQNADVVTTILILQKKHQDTGSVSGFYIWKKPLELIAGNEYYKKTIINSSLLNKVQDENIMSCASYSKEEITSLRNLNLSFNALFHDVKWLLEIKDLLVPLRIIFKVFRGSRRGWDALFFPQNCNIEPDFLFPALFNARNIKTLDATTDKYAFCCDKTEQELKESYPNAYKWVKRFENVKNGKGIPLPQVLKRTKEKWYEMKPNEVADFFTMMNPDNRMFFGRFKNPSFINQRLIGLNFLKENQDTELYHALLNSILMKFFIEAIGFGRGLGVLDIKKESIENCYMLNPELLSPAAVKNIKYHFSIIRSKYILSIEDELRDLDWIEFNKSILDGYGIVKYYHVICNSLRSLRKVRNAAKEKYDGIEQSNVMVSTYQPEETGDNLLAAESQID